MCQAQNNTVTRLLLVDKTDAPTKLERSFPLCQATAEFEKATFSSDKVAHSTKPNFLALFPFSGNCRYPGLNLSISRIFDSIRAQATFFSEVIFQQENVFFLHVCFHRMSNVDNICLISKHNKNENEKSSNNFCK